MDTLVKTSKYEIICSGCAFVEEDYVEFLIEGLIFRLYLSIENEEGSNDIKPYVRYHTEEIDGKRMMVVRAYNYKEQTPMTLTGPIHLANVKGGKLLFRFSSFLINGENGRKDHAVYYSWFHEKNTLQQPPVSL